MAKVKAGVRRERRRFWAGHIEAWRGSGQSKQAYCRDRGLNPASFYRWCKQLGERQPVSAGPRFVPVRLTSTSPLGRGVELRLPTGCVMRIDGGADPTWVAHLVRELTAPC